MPAGLGFGISLVGDKDLIRKLDRLGKKGYRRTVAKAASKAMTPVAKLAKRLAPVGTGPTRGLLKKSIGKKSKWYRGTRVVIIGPRTTFKRVIVTRKGIRRVNPVNYAHLVELGHRAVTGGKVERLDGRSVKGPKTGRVVGHVAGQPFLRPALFQNKENIKRILHRELRAGLLREAKKK